MYYNNSITYAFKKILHESKIYSKIYSNESFKKYMIDILLY